MQLSSLFFEDQCSLGDCTEIPGIQGRIEGLATSFSAIFKIINLQESAIYQTSSLSTTQQQEGVNDQELLRYISLAFQNLIPATQRISDLCQLQIQERFDSIRLNLQVLLYVGGFTMVLVFLVIILLGNKNLLN